MDTSRREEETDIPTNTTDRPQRHRETEAGVVLKRKKERERQKGEKTYRQRNWRWCERPGQGLC